MSNTLSQELRMARKKAGLSQRELAHLLNVNQSIISGLESGHIAPKVKQIVTLSVIYGRSFEGFFAEIMTEVHHELRRRLSSLPANVRQTFGTLNRATTLERLRERLVAESPDHDAAP